MACSVCKQKGHVKNSCPVQKEKDRLKLELALTERRYLLESLDTAARLLQVPIVTATVWFLMSRSVPTLGVLNKAILAAELAPVIGDIKFPEGVLLGAAMESTEDVVNILHDEGILEETYDQLLAAVAPAAIPLGNIIGPFITPTGVKKFEL